ncbi:hypothetical protein [Sphingomonas colocasiae]|uniref:Uncharacterized protein n=1 Tax=Sphingomonas colocasiae TaxID=1848973 RepID=A0ABS7PMJ4_9SPHN|nr:hypothetical protein [Sphingomonas colocasiae]MBY8822536.1 hypothetical protein [Sphingomonas colocasiae]
MMALRQREAFRLGDERGTAITLDLVQPVSARSVSRSDHACNDLLLAGLWFAAISAPADDFIEPQIALDVVIASVLRKPGSTRAFARACFSARRSSDAGR